MIKDITEVITLTVQEFADKKGCTRKTVYNNLNDLTLIGDKKSKLLKIIWDEKAKAWKHKKSMARHGAKKK